MWLASRSFLDVRNTQRRLTASVAHEHEIVRAAHASFRQVTAFVITMLPWHPLFLCLLTNLKSATFLKIP